MRTEREVWDELAPMFEKVDGNMRWWRWRNFKGLWLLAADLPRGATGLEIGSFAGESAAVFVEAGEVAALHCVDSWDRSEYRKERIQAAEDTFDSVAAKYAPRVLKHKGRSDKVVPELAKAEGRRFGFAYVDGDHSYRAVLKDIELARSVLHAGGWLCGHDYGRKQFPGVTRAVREALGVPDKTYPDSSWVKLL